MTLQAGDRTVVVGIDGADLRLIRPWLDAGELPAVRRIVDGGVSGPLESVCPPVTSPNWKAYATGKNPGKLGVFWWWNTDTERRETYRPADRYNDHAEIWEYLAEGEPVGVVGVPTTYPPKAVGEFVVSGAPDAEASGFTHPPPLEADLRDRFDYRVTRDHLLRAGRDAAFAEVLDRIDETFEAARHLADRHDVSFLQATTFHVNLLHHTVWDDLATLRGWKLIDRHLASFLDEGTNVVLVSDHGMAEIRSVFRINRWLQREGYLVHDATGSRTLHELGVSSDRLKRLVDRANGAVPSVDLKRLANEVAPRWLLDRLPDADGELGASKHALVDWESSDALAGQLGPVYLLADPGSPRYERLRAELIDRLGRLRDPDGRPVAREVVRAEERYDGPYVDEGPDILVVPERGIHVAEGLGPADVFSDGKEAWRAVNARDGLFAATGPAFGSGEATDLSILDVAPTLLHLHGRGVPTDMDGEVRRDLFAAGSEPATRQPRAREPLPPARVVGEEPASGDMEARLRDLGYL